MGEMAPEFSPAPGTPQTYAKAIAGFVASFLTLAGGSILLAVNDGHLTGNEILAILIIGLGGSAATGVTVAKTRNKPLRPREQH